MRKLLIDMGYGCVHHQQKLSRKESANERVWHNRVIEALTKKKRAKTFKPYY